MGVFTFNPHTTQQMESMFIALSEKKAPVGCLLGIWQHRLCWNSLLLSCLPAPSPPLFLKCSISGSLREKKKKVLYASFEPWLAQEEKLSYKESLKDSKLSTPGLSELLKDVSSFFSFSSFRPSALFREFFSFSNKIIVLLLYLWNDSREILDNLFSGSSFVSSTCFNFCNKKAKILETYFFGNQVILANIQLLSV